MACIHKALSYHGCMCFCLWPSDIAECILRPHKHSSLVVCSVRYFERAIVHVCSHSWPPVATCVLCAPGPIIGAPRFMTMIVWVVLTYLLMFAVQSTDVVCCMPCRATLAGEVVMTGGQVRSCGTCGVICTYAQTHIMHKHMNSYMHWYTYARVSSVEQE